MSAGVKPTDEHCPQVIENAGSEVETKPPWRRIVLLAAIVGVLLAIIYLFPSRDYPGRLRELGGYVRSLRLLGPLVLVLSTAILVAIGFPRLLFCGLAGMALGFWSGLLWAQLGTLLGNYAVFMLVRRGGRNWAERYLSKRGKLHNLIQREGIPGVILARQLPVPGLLINLACGLFSVRRRDFLLGTIIGQLPEAIPCTLIGAGALQASFAKSLGTISLAVVVAVVAWLGLRILLRRQRAKPAEPEPAKMENRG